MIRGFGVPAARQSLTKTRKPITGTKDGIAWSIEGRGDGLFQWKAGDLSGWTPHNSTVETALGMVKDAIETLAKMVSLYGPRAAMPDRMEQLGLLRRWERYAAQGRLKVKMKRRKDRSVYWTVEEA